MENMQEFDSFGVSWKKKDWLSAAENVKGL